MSFDWNKRVLFVDLIGGWSLVAVVLFLSIAVSGIAILLMAYLAKFVNWVISVL